VSDWSTIELATDADLSAQESRMPDAAKQTPSKGGFFAYNGKRALAKRDIEAVIRRRGWDPQFLTDPSQLNRAATFLELAYIYRDLSHRSDTVSAEKARYYTELYMGEIETVILSYSPTTDADSGGGVRLMIPFRRA